MPEGQVLEFTNVTKRFNEVTAVSDFSARVEPGAVTAFLGPNGAGKTTTLRILLGQVRPTSGTATIGGVAYAELRQPLRTIGAVLEETAYRPRRTASRQLTIAAKANGIRLARVDEVISLVGLEDEADTRIGGFSLGMRQRLSVAHALLGDPGALVFDEPANGLDPEGIRWMRLLMRRLADEGRTVLVSSHVLSEIEQVADHVLVLSKGRLVLSSGIETLADPAGGSVVVDSVDRPGLTTALVAAGFDIEVLRSGLTVRGTDASRVGAVAADAGIALSTLVQRGPTLEDVFIDLMRGGRFDTAPAVEPSEDASTGTETVTTGDAAAGAAASALAAGGAAALADDLSTEIPGDAAATGSGDDDETAGAEGPVDDETTQLVTVVETAAGDETVQVIPVVEETAALTLSDAEEETDAEPDTASDAESDSSRSFDDILFGAPAPVPATESPRRSFAALFAASSAEMADEDTAEARTSPEQSAGQDAPAPGESDETTPAASVPADGAEIEGPETPSDIDAADDTTGTEDAESAADEPEPAGVEFFSELDAASAANDETATADTTQPAEASDPATDDEDPRSAAVSSMLAAAARAYYEDEPRDYPLASAEGDAPAETASSEEQPSADDESSEEPGAHAPGQEQAPDAQTDEDHGARSDENHG
ncbi:MULTISPECIES: ATP-binding cassette domain-containing protein [unclassified Microbacterium]|uniref:ATP-binding cassette domain-containing protein n=1 Tax=unclassified Microbacterium TaxID=2609290 RepID=UPI0025E62935|nr:MULTISPECIES: ATP-binding cassette domain-containing protein [unclassified Microbacterium]